MEEPIVIIKKKRVQHGGHHGGAWKVAYADFVTAMMSLFIVLWLISSNEAVKKSVAAYFQDPKGTSRLEGSANQGAGNAIPMTQEEMGKLKQRLQQAARQLPQFAELSKQIEISASPDGLRIELLEQSGGTFFEMGNANPTPVLAQFLTVMSHELGNIPNRISIEGHTDSTPYNVGSGYSNWELSADRANAARRIMQSNGIGADQIEQVRGFASQLPRVPGHPEDPSNRRITVIVAAAPAASTEAEEVAEASGRPQKE
jgi:chemotaxis protein MotB